MNDQRKENNPSERWLSLMSHKFHNADRCPATSFSQNQSYERMSLAFSTLFCGLVEEHQVPMRRSLVPSKPPTCVHDSLGYCNGNSDNNSFSLTRKYIHHERVRMSIVWSFGCSTIRSKAKSQVPEECQEGHLCHFNLLCKDILN